ncbi:MAG: asparagine synthase, partial [Bacteroidetes bacterium]|nr:asparagine synthase [Bacteroidota bacterium]
ELSIETVQEFSSAVEQLVKKNVDSKTGIFLSSGIDSAIVASYLPKGTKAYTLKCDLGEIDETKIAEQYARTYDLDWKMIIVTWKDYQKYLPTLMISQGMPIHSIGPQIYKGLIEAKNDGLNSIVTGFGADDRFGGLNRILSRDWHPEEFMRWYTYVDPQKALKKPVSMMNTIFKFVKEDGFIDVFRFISNGPLGEEGDTSFNNPFNLTGIKHISIYTKIGLNKPLDIQRIRHGEPKYLVRELFKLRYPNFNIPDKIPMPRAVNQWLADWDGPKRSEFIPNCHIGMTGEQKWLLFCLEKFLDMIEPEM